MGHLSTVDELRAACARLATAAGGERRIIERALHDGVQQDLIAVSVRLQLVRQLAGADVPAAIALLDEIGRDVRGALERVQALANEIYPSLLEARGLPDALRGAARVDAAGVGRYPADLEAAVYFWCRAALDAFATPTGDDARATIQIREVEHALRVEVTQDTVALDTTVPAMRLARDRVEALGGVVSAASEPGDGTRLALTVPLA